MVHGVIDAQIGSLPRSVTRVTKEEGSFAKTRFATRTPQSHVCLFNLAGIQVKQAQRGGVRADLGTSVWDFDFLFQCSCLEKKCTQNPLSFFFFFFLSTI